MCVCVNKLHFFKIINAVVNIYLFIVRCLNVINVKLVLGEQQ